jgi:hypothetical protein
MFSNENKPKTSFIFFCEKCEYGTSKKSNINNHYATAKHMKSIVSNENKPKTSSNYICQNCNKIYKDPSGLWRHKKNCKSVNNEENNIINEDLQDKDQLIMMLIKQNSELIKETSDFKNMIIDQNKQMIELAKNAGNNCNNITTNSHNKAFNLQFFLNETCKDAMNIMDFVDSIKLQLSDLENVGKLGYVNGISNIIIKNLKELDVEKRPVHCTDKKRETMYVKDENKWEKDEKNNKIRKAIKRVVSKNQRLFPKFKEAHPDCNTYHSKFSDQYNKLILESCGGSGDNDLEKEEKIIQNISKNVLVDK